MITGKDIQVKVEVKFGLKVYSALYRGVVVTEGYSINGVKSQALVRLNKRG